MNKKNANKKVYLIIAILFLALFVRIYTCFFSGLIWKTTDTFSYYAFADSLKRGSYIEPFMPPGYSFLILLLDHFGSRDFTMIVFNIIASVSVCLFVYFICYKLTRSEKTAFLAMCILAVYPNNVNYVRYILTETPTMFLVTASAFLLLYFDKSFVSCFLSGLLLGMAGITRITCLPMVFFPFFAYLIDKKYKRSMLLLISFILPLIIALGLNYSNTKRFFISNNLAINLIMSAESRSDNIYYYGSKDLSHQRLIRENDVRNAACVYIREIKNNPKEWIIKRLISAWELWGPYPLPDGRRSVLMRILIGLRFILFILLIRGGYFLARRNGRDFLILCGPVITITLVHLLTFSNPRYTHVIEPLAICLAVYSLSKALAGREAVRMS